MYVYRLVFGFPLLFDLLVFSGIGGEPFSLGRPAGEAFRVKISGPNNELLNPQKLVEVLHVECTDDGKCVAIAQFGADHYVVTNGRSECAPMETSLKPIEDPLAFPITLVYPKRGLRVQVREDDSIMQVTYSDKCECRHSERRSRSRG